LLGEQKGKKEGSNLVTRAQSLVLGPLTRSSRENEVKGGGTGGNLVERLVFGCLAVAVGTVVVVLEFSTFTRPLPAFFRNPNDKTAMVIEVLLASVTAIVLAKLAAQYSFQENPFLQLLTEGLGFGVGMGLAAGLARHRRAHKRIDNNSSF
jgi:uncharacterized membrane protein